MKKYLYFYDRIDILLDRYPAKIAYQIQKSTLEFGFVFIYSEKFSKSWKPNFLPENSIVIYSPFLAEKTLQKLILKYPPVAFVNIALRIPDIFMLGFFNKLNVPSYVVQHGLFVKHLARVPFLNHVSNKLGQFIKYAVYSYRISKLIGKPSIKTLNDLYLCYIKGAVKYSDLKTLKDSNLLSYKVFSFDSTWDNYYINYGYVKSQMIYFGNPDYSLVKQFEMKPVENSICYICQTLVEDGRYIKKDFIDFISNLKNNLANEKVYLKLHPRSNMDLYKKFENENLILTTSFINCDTYLGHYSSLLEISYQLGRNVILWELQDHEIPENYKNYADLTTSDWSELKKYLERKKRDNFKVRQKMSQFLELKHEPFEIIANQLEKDLI
jgi:hypothetical protein